MKRLALILIFIGAMILAFALGWFSTAVACTTDTECGCTDDCLESK